MMTITERIDNICEKLQTARLSTILPLLLPISLECEDYSGYCMLSYWGKPLCKEKDANIAIRKEMHRVLLAEGLASKNIAIIENDAFDDYMKLRAVGKDQICMLSAKEMEDKMQSYKDAASALDTPAGLHPVDLYYLNEEHTTSKLKLINSRQQVEQQYAVLQTFIVSKLTEYRRKNAIEERKTVMSKRIENSKKVFIIHGHSEAKRRELKELLKDKFHLVPIILSEQPDQGLTIIEKFEKYAADCSYAFALFTPDDIVTNGEHQYFQARPNVIFELGWFYANLGRSRVCILDQASDKSQIFSDLQGVLRMQFNNAVSEKYIEIERELKSVGIIN